MKKMKPIPTGPQEADSAAVCAYAAQTVTPRLTRMLSESKAAKRGKTTEPIHQMRVWSRRSRAALEIFRPCFSGRKFAKLAQAVHAVTGALGTARDMDVMIAAIRQQTDALPPEQRPELRAFVERLQSQRKAVQPFVAKSVRELKKRQVKRTAKNLTELFATPPRPAKRKKERKKAGRKKRTAGSVDRNAMLADNAERLISVRLDALFAYEACLEDAANVTEHHAMRIAAKKLRYTMDIFQEAVVANLPDAAPFLNALEAVRSLQEHLGEMHDADVVAPQLAAHLTQMLRDSYCENHKGEPTLGVHCVSFDACEGVLTLCRAAASRRDERFGQLRLEWEALKTTGTFTALRAALNRAANPALPEATLPESPRLEIVIGAETLPTPTEPMIAETEETHEEARAEPIHAAGGAASVRTARTSRPRAANSRRRAESGADTPPGAAKSGMEQPAPAENGKSE